MLPSSPPRRSSPATELAAAAFPAELAAPLAPSGHGHSRATGGKGAEVFPLQPVRSLPIFEDQAEGKYMEVDRLSEAASRVGNAAGDSAMAPMAATIHGSVDSVRDLESARVESGESAVQQHPTTAGWNRRVRVGANPIVS